MNKQKIHICLFFNTLVILFLFSNLDMQAQTITKAEIKKPQQNIVGRWSPVAKIEKGKRRTIESEYVYDFFPDGLYRHIKYYSINKSYIDGEKPDGQTKVAVLERGTWELTDSGKILLLHAESPIFPKKECDIIEKQALNQPNPDAFAIKRLIGQDSVSFIYMRKPFPLNELNTEEKTNDFKNKSGKTSVSGLLK